MAQTQPATTLRADSVDAPAPASIDEAARAATGMSPAAHDATTPGPQHDHHPPPPRPPSEHHHHDGNGVGS
jgi:hypothetical protein